MREPQVSTSSHRFLRGGAAVTIGYLAAVLIVAALNNQKMVTSLGMDGTSAAFSEFIDCQRAYDAQKKSRDPFAG